MEEKITFIATRIKGKPIKISFFNSKGEKVGFINKKYLPNILKEFKELFKE